MPDLTKYHIQGGKPLRGSITISGAKNAAVAIIPAALLVDGVCRIENIPQISDVTLILQILQELGADIRTVNRTTVDVDCSHIRNARVPEELARKIRASYYLIGALLGRFGSAEVPPPGGCDFGGRPIDQHIKGFVAMGANVDVRGGYIHAKASNGRMNGTQIYLDIVSVGATMNIMLAAALADGMTIIENAAKEPHIVDLANFLNSMGAEIMGAGTDVIKIRGVERLTGGTYSIIPDQIEAGTYMTAVAATGGEVLIKNVIPKHLECITAKLLEMGVDVEERDDAVLVRRTGKLTRTNVKTLPYPGFPTDMQPQIAAVLCLAEGTSVITEGVWDNRYRYVDEFRRPDWPPRAPPRSATSTTSSGAMRTSSASCPAWAPTSAWWSPPTRTNRPRWDNCHNRSTGGGTPPPVFSGKERFCASTVYPGQRLQRQQPAGQRRNHPYSGGRRYLLPPDHHRPQGAGRRPR